MNMGRLMLLTFRITGHFSLFFARLSLRYLEKSWYYQPFWVWQGHPNFGETHIVASMVSLAFMRFFGISGLNSFGCWQRHPLQLSQKIFICFVFSQTNLKCQDLKSGGFFEVISVVFKGSTVNLFSELSTKAANRLLLFRYLHKNWTQQVFLYIAKIDIWEACQACF